MEKASDQQDSAESRASMPAQLADTPVPSQSLGFILAEADAQSIEQRKRVENGAGTFTRSILQLIQRVKPLDISGVTEDIAERLDNDDETETRVIITDLGTGCLFPPFDLTPHLARVRNSRRLLMGIAAVIVVSGVFASWLLLFPHESHPTIAKSGPRVLFSTTELGSLDQPGWSDDSQYSDGGLLMTCPLPPAPPRSKAQGICGEQQLSFVDDGGNLYRWNQSTGKLAKELTLKRDIFQGSSAFRWRWLYPGRYIVSYEQIPGSLATYRLWDATQNVPLFTVQASPSFATGNPPFALTADGWIATLTSRHTIQIWKTHAPLPGETYPAGVTTLASFSFAHLVALNWSPDGSELAIASSDGTIQIWAPFAHQPLLQTLRVKRTQDAPPLHEVQMVWSPDGKRLASDISVSTTSNPIQIWELQSGRLLQSYLGQNGYAGWLTWLDQGTVMLSGSPGNGVQIWDTTTGHVMDAIDLLIGSTSFLPASTQLQVSPDRRWLIFPEGYNGIQIIDLRVGKLLYTLPTQDNDELLNLALSPDSTQLATADEYGQVQIWNVRSGRLVTTYQLPADFSSQFNAFLSGHGDWSVPVDLAWSLNSQVLAVTYQGGGLVVLDTNA